MTEAWTAPQAERTEPGLILGERPALEAWLDFHRDALLLKCAGLTAGQLKERAVPPCRLSLLGLVWHMTEVERWCFRIHAADTGLPFPYDPDQTGQDFEALDDADAAADIEAFTHEVEHARAAAAGRRLDNAVPSHGHPRALPRHPLDLPAHDRGVRAPQRPRRPHPGADRRQHRRLTPAPTSPAHARHFAELAPQSSRHTTGGLAQRQIRLLPSERNEQAGLCASTARESGDGTSSTRLLAGSLRR
jgi:hypothetical protein